MPIFKRRNIVLLDTKASLSSMENRGMMFHVAEFLLKVDAIILNNRYEKERRATKRRRLTLLVLVLVIISVLSVCLTIQSLHAVQRSEELRIKAEELRERAEEHTEFEKNLFPSSIVFGYAKNFLVPLIKATTGSDSKPEKCIMVIAMPQDYSELPNRPQAKKEHFIADASSLGWEHKGVSVPVPGRSPITIVEIFPKQSIAGVRVYADMASTVTAIKHVVDYLTTEGNSKFHANTMEEKEKLTLHYLSEFKKVLMEVLSDKKELGSPVEKNYEIHFVGNHEELKSVLDGIRANSGK